MGVELKNKRGFRGFNWHEPICLEIGSLQSCKLHQQYELEATMWPCWQNLSKPLAAKYSHVFIYAVWMRKRMFVFVWLFYLIEWRGIFSCVNCFTSGFCSTICRQLCVLTRWDILIEYMSRINHPKALDCRELSLAGKWMCLSRTLDLYHGTQALLLDQSAVCLRVCLGCSSENKDTSDRGWCPDPTVDFK